MKHNARVCLVTSGNLASNPRLVKEALSLCRDGYAVRIIAGDVIRSLSEFDAEIARELRCDVVKVAWDASYSVRLFRRFRRHLARFTARCFRSVPLWIAALAHHPLTAALTSAARSKPADLFIAHNLAALPAAASAAGKYGAHLGFDAEDYHCGELIDVPADRLEFRIRRSIEGELLSKCRHLTSASPQISEAYAVDYGVRMTSVLNVFPRSDAPAAPLAETLTTKELMSLYWFSQTIGPGRGLEQVIDAMALMRTRVRLCLRGNPQIDYVKSLTARAVEKGGNDLASRVIIAPVAAPDQMVRLAALHDLGLATEPGCNPNNNIALSNKAFAYLLGGVPVLFSKTKAQSELAEALAGAALLVDIFDATKLAEILDRYFSNPEKRRQMRMEAWQLGHERYNWDVEQGRFLGSIQEVFAQC